VKDKNALISYWLGLAKEDLKVMKSLFGLGHYPYALFIGHLAIEKLLKAFYVWKKGKHPPFTHDLGRLASESGIMLTDEQKGFLDAVTQFNIEARYPDLKLSFYKRANKKFTEKYTKDIEEFFKWLESKIKY